MLKSPALAGRLARELKLEDDRNGWRRQGVKDSARGAKPANLTAYSVSSGFVGSPEQPASVLSPPVDAGIVDAVAKAIDIRHGLSYVVEVSATSQSPERAAEMANGLSNIYLKSLAEARYDTSEKANAWLKDRLDELKIEVQQKQAAAQATRLRNLMTVQGTALPKPDRGNSNAAAKPR
jgi:uncharacterized protein involved in exopolysaccharide biosynthesis